MIFWDIEQNTEEWYLARAGIPTASQFNRIVTKTGKISEQHKKYAYECVAEIYMQRALDTSFTSRDMQWGHDYEEEAVRAYEMLTGYTVKRGGFFTDDNINYGASPDVRIYDGNKLIGVAEIKCPQVSKHIEYVLMEDIMNPEYIPQVQGHALVAEEIEFVDWFSYHPDLPHALVRNKRDNSYISLLKERLHEFQKTIEFGLQVLRDKNFNVEKPIKTMDFTKKSFVDLSVGLDLQKPL